VRSARWREGESLKAISITRSALALLHCQTRDASCMPQIRQTRIFAPHRGRYEHERWAETMIGQIVAPVVDQFHESLAWYWFTRYKEGRDGSAGDCDLARIPLDFMDQENDSYRSIRFRYAVAAEQCDALEERCRQLINEQGCAISDFRDYEILADLASDRHLEEPRTQERCERRARLVVEQYWAVSKLILDALQGPDEDGRYHLPHHSLSAAELVRGETPFRTFHHIFCNSTDFPLYVELLQEVPGVGGEAATLRRILHRLPF
jgi:hypothetical protein